MLQALNGKQQTGGGEKRRKELKNLTKQVLLRRIRKYEKKENKKAKINMSHKKQVMIDYIDANIEEKRIKFDLRRNKKKKYWSKNIIRKRKSKKTT